MAHTVVVHVKFADVASGSGSPDGLKMLNELVVPNAKAQPGFQSGTWMNEGLNGMSVVLFDTEENAKAAAAKLKPPPGGPTLVSSVVFQVGATA